jgi:hypothetical protein
MDTDTDDVELTWTLSRNPIPTRPPEAAGDPAAEAFRPP